MTSIERTAYPRFKRFLSARELHVFYTPQPEEIRWTSGQVRSDGHPVARHVRTWRPQLIAVTAVVVVALAAAVIRHDAGRATTQTTTTTSTVTADPLTQSLDGLDRAVKR